MRTAVTVLAGAVLGAVLAVSAVAVLHLAPAGQRGHLGPRGPQGSAGHTGQSAVIAHLGFCAASDNTTGDVLVVSPPVLISGVASCEAGAFISIVPAAQPAG